MKKVLPQQLWLLLFLVSFYLEHFSLAAFLYFLLASFYQKLEILRLSSQREFVLFPHVQSKDYHFEYRAVSAVIAMVNFT